MFQGLLVGAAFFGSKLMGALVELRGHLDGFFRGTAEGDKDLGELCDFHREYLIRKVRMQEPENVFLISCIPN